MPRTLHLTILLTLAVSAQLAAQPAPEPRPWATVLGRDTMSRAQVGVLATLEKAVPISGRRVSVLHLRIDEVLWGKLEARQLNAIQQERTTPEQDGQKLVAFLRRLRSSWEVSNLFYLGGKDGPRKLAVLRQHLSLEALPAAKQDAAHRAAILSGLQSRLTWEFSLSMGELHKRVVDRGGILEPRFRRALNGLAFNLPKSGHEKVLRALLALLPAPGRARPSGPEPGRRTPAPVAGGEPLTGGEAVAWLAQSSDPRVRVLRIHRLVAWPGPETRAALIGLLESARPPERAACAFVLGQVRAPAAVKPLTRALLRETDTSAARALVRALGLLRAADAVAEIARRGQVAELFAESALALGRIRSPRARLALHALGAEQSEPDRKRLARYYASKAFADRDGTGR